MPRSLRQGLGQVVFWTAPAAAWLIVCAEPLVRMVYERQRFSPAASVATAQVLSLYALGLVPLALNVILPRAYYARQDTRTPLLATLAGTALYLLLAIPGARPGGRPQGWPWRSAWRMRCRWACSPPGYGVPWPANGPACWAAPLAPGLAATGMGLGCLGLRLAADHAGLLAGPFPVQAATVGGLALAGAALFWILDWGLGIVGRARGRAAALVPRPSYLSTSYLVP